VDDDRHTKWYTPTPVFRIIRARLSASGGADSPFLQRISGPTRGSLSKRENAGLASIEKRFAGKTPNTVVSLADNGCDRRDFG
jgi:hypothetical protein